MNLIFVYGTLKRGGHNHHFLAGQTLVGPARTEKGYTLYDLGGYPGLVPDVDNPQGVTGEVWSVDEACIMSLDVLEGTSEGLYRRMELPMEQPFAKDRVEAYVYLKSIKDCRPAGQEWTG